MTERIDPFEALEPYARLLLHRALGRDGTASFTQPRHAGLIRALAHLLEEPSPPPERAMDLRSDLLRRAPDLAPHVDLLERCAERLTDVLAGRILASDVLFPGGSMDVVEPVYRGNRWSDHFNALTARAVAYAVAACRAEHPEAIVRVLEVGAGTGGTSGAVLAALEPHVAYVAYDYTDVSPGFVQHGRRVHGKGRPFFSGRLLDLEKAPAEQGYDAATYDVVLGTNVLHATSRIADSLRHINWLLRKGGLLLLNEITRAGAFATMTFGLLDGWWAFRDGELRLPDAPVVSPQGWRRVLPTLGFNEPAVLGWNDPPDSSFQCLFVAAKVAEATADVLREAPAASVAPVPAPALIGVVEGTADLRPELARYLGGLLGLEAEELAYDRPMREFGVDSIVVPQYVTLLNRELGCALAPTDIFNCVTLAGLAEHLARTASVPARVEALGLKEPAAPSRSDIAVIGLACRFPEAPDADAFWANLVAGRRSITEVPAARWNGRADGKTRWGAFLDEHDCFDPEFFNLSWREAEAMSPQQRVFLEQTWNALENAGYGRRSLAGRRCGVFVGAAPDGYGIHDNDSLSSLGGSLAILSARISYLLDLKGPSLPLDTACSSSLVAVHLACQSLRAGDCDMALAGGVSVLMTDGRLHRFLDDAGMLSLTGQCHTFDAAADGFVPGEGVGVVVLKRLDAALADGDDIIGVIKASGINQDGRSSGITAPNGPSQTSLELAVYERAGVSPAEIGLVEAHGTGTQLGDPIEVSALSAAFRHSTDRRGFCALGSVKTNIGHTLTTAGVAGLIKALLAVKHGTIPPSLNFARENPQIDLAGSPFFVPRQAMPWMGAARLAAVSSFGFSGTNAHVVVSEAPVRPGASRRDGPALILLSGRTAEALEARREDLLRWLATHEAALGDLAYTLSHGRSHFEHRLAVLVDSLDDLRNGRGRSWQSAPLVLPARDGQDAALERLLAQPAPDLAAIAECYIAGGDGDWSRLAAPGARRVALPGYRFAREKFPVRIGRPGPAVSPPPVPHSMLGADVSAAGARAYEVNLDGRQSWLRDHQFGGSPVVPAVAYLELARAAAVASGIAAGRLHDVRFERPLRAGTGPAPRIVLQQAGAGAATFEVVGAGEVVHARGRVAGSNASEPSSLNLPSLAQTFSHDEIYAQFGRLGFEYGPSFRVIRSLRAGPSDVLAEIAPAVPTEAGLELDPALLDGAIQAAVGLMLASREALASVVPVGVGAVTIYGPVCGPCVAHVSLLSDAGERRRLRIRILEPTGRLLVVLDDLEIRVAAADAQAGGDGVHLYSTVWEDAPLGEAPVPSAVLLFDRDEALWSRLGERAILMRPGSAFCRLDERSFAIDPAAADDYARVLALLRDERRLPEAIWHLWSCRHGAVDPQTASRDAVDQALRDGLQSIVHLCAALTGKTPDAPIAIVHGHADMRDEAPLQAPVAGFGAALARENPLLQLVSVAIGTTDLGQRLALLSAETQSARTVSPSRTQRWSAAGPRQSQRLRAETAPASRPAGGLRPGATVLLTGALGGIGRHVARHLAARYQARLLLVGRSAAGPASEALMAEIRAAGGDAAYHSADVANETQTAAAVAAARSRFGALHAVIHAAGVTRDRFLLHKTPDDLAAVFAPKIAGTLALDRATASDPLDVFVCFSSLAGTFGNAGQTDYSAANRFLDSYMAARGGPGRSLAIGWPYWQEGGLSVDRAELDRRAATTGIRVLETAEGLAMLDALLAGASGSFLVLPGDRMAIDRLVGGASLAVAPAPAKKRAASVGAPVHDAALAYLREVVALTTAMPVERIHPDRPLEQYGLDSLLVTKLNAALEVRLPGLPKTLFFEHQTLRSVAGYLAATRSDAFSAPVAESPPVESVAAPARAVEQPAAADGIAIIGIAGRYPGANSLAEFWANLLADRDLITEIPPERWDQAAWFDAMPKPGRSYSKWGGFLSGVDAFDPLFFNIAPGEAARIDPNERLFLETCWEALENAGHTRASLARDPARAVGVYAGVMYGEYQLLAAQAQAAGGGAVEGASPYWSVANRVSYHLDLHGPSLTVDSACSSSLTAIHLACQALASGECSVAIAGGVNLNLHPLKYVGLSQGRFASSDGHCHSFAAGGDGYVPGEGVGAVILKPLAAALADGDYVHAVIRGWAANHGGKTNGYTVPNPNAQGAVIEAALRRGGVAPGTVSYIEAHGTGTELGDPIEVAGLTAAFGEAVPRQSCALGSIKANIGHLEAAAGIAGLTRVVLQLQHRTLTPTRRHGPPNLNIDFAATPFRLQEGAEPWTTTGPLRAGVSSFGAGGANAHLVVEEFRPERLAAGGAGEPALLIVSARTEGQLKAYAGRLAGYLRQAPFRLVDVCRTLQVGREAMAARLAFVGTDAMAAADALEAFAGGRTSAVLSKILDEEAAAPAAPDVLDLNSLAQSWVDGAAIVWRELSLPGAIVPVPPRPFMRRRYWIDVPRQSTTTALHPFLDRAEPSLDGARFVKRFDPAMPVVRDHKIQGRLLVPGVVQLEMVRAALTEAGCKATVLRDVVWPAPLVVAAAGTTVTTTLRRSGDAASFELVAEDAGLVCRGSAAESVAVPPRHDIAALRAGAARHLTANDIYDRLRLLGLEYGPSLRPLTDIWTSGAKMVAALSPADQPAPTVVLPPATLDGALQSLLGLAEDGADRLFVPFALAELRLYGNLAAARFVIASRRAGEGDVVSFDLAICDATGTALLSMAGLAARPGSRTKTIAAPVPLTLRAPVWRESSLAGDIAPDAAVLVAHGGDDLGLTVALGRGRVVRPVRGDDTKAIAAAMERATDLVWIAVAADERGMAVQAETLALDLLHAVQALEQSGRLARALRLRIVTRGLQSVSPRERPDPRAGALIGLAKSVALEFPRVAVTLTDLDEATLAGSAAAQAVLAETAAVPVRETAWRAGVRHVLAMAPAALPQSAPPLQPGSVLLIVGGAGGIGRVLAGWFAQECGARVALVGRRAESEVAADIAAVPCGAGSVRYFQADATDPAAMVEAVAAIRALWGGIDAAIHAALVLRDRTLMRMDDATFRAALAPKIAGSIVLADALAGETLQFFAFLSSVNVISGSRGQSNYVAGSSFADAFARHLAAERPWRVVVTDWGLWGDVGVVSDETYRQRLARQGVHPILPAEGIATLAAILNGTTDRVAIARAEPEALRQLGLDEAVPRTSLDDAKALAVAETAFAALERYGRVVLAALVHRMAGDDSSKAWTTEGLRRKLGVASRHAALFPALLDALGRDELIDSADGLWRLRPVRTELVELAGAALDTAMQAAPWLAGPRRLLQICLDAYEPLLRGAVDPLAVLFPQGSMAAVEAAYTGHPIADHFNAEIGRTVRAQVEAAPADRPLRVIELGAGTGSTTSAVLDGLGPVATRVEYVATDVSQRFLAHGAQRFAGRTGIAFALYDIERDVETNAMQVGSFDVVLAANVVHATADLAATLRRIRRLLRPGGRLLLSEATRAQDFGTVVFGLTPGWWLAQDRQRRIPFSPLASVEGWRTLLTEAGFGDVQALTAGTSSASPHAVLVATNREAFAAIPVARRQAVAVPVAARAVTGGHLSRLQQHLRAVLADVLKLDPEDVRLNESFDRYGLESLTALEIRNRLDQEIPGLPATLLFEHNTLARLAGWLAEAHADSVARLFADAMPVEAPPQPTPPREAPEPAPVVHRVSAADEPIAIIGFSGRYPGGADADAFWQLLCAGDSAIREVPAARWDAAAMFDAAGGEGRSYTKWAGFIDEVDRFDPLFFNISPLEAEVMDPQERLFLETAWATLEQAGYSPARLRARAAALCPDGGDVGVFVGAMNAPYQWIAAEAWAAGHANAASTGYWSIANRASFLMDFSGPSLVVDTACSASLTAIHLACESLRRGECGAALAGGVNLILHPRQFVNLSQARMVSRGAECRAFGADADGFVDGEGVGAVLLKPLSAAERDGDRIEGVILGSAVNTGGRTSGFTVPNPKAQARVIDSALRRAGVTPETISYVEAHGTGTALGDPIEIAGLAGALGSSGRCFIGALKANIGHLESAAGVAGLTKVLLQLRHRTIAPSRHAGTPNPLIDLTATPFVLPVEPVVWQPALPGERLRAGISSFGAGGANAHLVIEEYVAPARTDAAETTDLVLLSARDPDQLQIVVERLLVFLRTMPVPLGDLAHTLRVGREAMAARLSLMADSVSDLTTKLTAWLEGRSAPGASAAATAGSTARMLSETEEGQALLAGLMARRDLERLGQLWSEGADIDWPGLPLVGTPRLIALPTYPFRRERYWLPSGTAVSNPTAASVAAIETTLPEEAVAVDRPARIQLFTRTWQPAAPAPGREPARVLVMARESGLAKQLAAVWPRPVIAVLPGVGFAVIDERTVRMDPFSEGDHAALIARFAGTDPDGFAVVQALDWQGASHPAQADGARASILLTQATQRSTAANVRVLHVFAAADDRPLDQAVGSLARSAMQESHACRMRAVGIAGTAAIDSVAGICRDELLASDDAPEVLYRGGARHTPQIEPCAADSEAATIGFRIGGAYLLVGGLGEVGCAIAERLAREYRAHIAIIGRSDPRGPALERLRKLRDAGIEVHYEACDLNDRVGLERAMAAIRGQFGRLHGVLHLARTVEDALLVRKSTSSVARVMAAKVEGSVVLDAVLAGEQLDWFVLCSSLAAWLGLAGGGDYALACAFQNGFADVRQRKVEAGERHGRTVAICWPQWQHDRYLNSAKLRRLAAEGLQTIDARDGLRIIVQALQSNANEVAAIKGAEPAFRRLALAYRPDTLSTVPAAATTEDDSIAAELQAMSDAELAAYLDHLAPFDAPKPQSPPAVTPAVPPPAAGESIEAIVVDTICSFLKLPAERFGPESEFVEFGLDSIKALHVAERLQKRLGVQVDPAMFYEFPRIGAFAQAVAARVSGRPGRVQR